MNRNVFIALVAFGFVGALGLSAVANDNPQEQIPDQQQSEGKTIKKPRPNSHSHKKGEGKNRRKKHKSHQNSGT